MKRRPGRTCRCFMCGRNRANNSSRSVSYSRVGIRNNEHGIPEGDKRRQRKLRRIREDITDIRERNGDG